MPSIELGFNPFEKRDAHGQWTKADVSAAADELDQRLHDMYKHDGVAAFQVSNKMSAATRDMRQGSVRTAARKLDEARQIMDRAGGGPERRYWQHRQANMARLADVAASLRTAAVYDPGYTQKMEQEAARMGKAQDAALYGSALGKQTVREMYGMANTVELGRPGSYRPPVQAGRWQPTTGMRKSTAASMRKLASKLKSDHEEMGSHLHVEDAARALERGDHDAAGRHLDAATANMTPQSLMRHGIVHDEDYHTAKANMDAIHRHRLLVRDIQDAHERNLQLLQDRPPGPDADDGANTVKPAQRIGQPDQEAAGQPRGKLPSGGSDPAVAEPKSITKWTVTKQVAASNDFPEAIELVGPKGYIHGWIKVGEQAGGQRSVGSLGAHFRQHMNEAHPGIQQDQHSHVMDHVANGGHAHSHPFLDRLKGDIANNIREGNEGSDLGLDPGATPLGRGAMYENMTQDKGKLATRYAPNTKNRPYPSYRGMSPKESENFDIAAAGFANGDTTTEILLAFNAMQPRDTHGRWTKGPENRLGTVTVGGKTSYANKGTRARLAQMLKEQNSTGYDKMPPKPAPPPAIANGGDPRGFPQATLDRIKAATGGSDSDWRAAIANYDQNIKQGKIAFGSSSSATKYPGKAKTDKQIADFIRSKVPLTYSNTYGLSAETARLAATPAPRGKPGGPGLYDVKGNEHSAYLQQIVKSLIDKRGMEPGKAYAIARASIRRWSRGGGHVHPEVRAAAGAAESQEDAAQARAHAHANGSAYARAIELDWRTEPRGKSGEWVGALGDLAGKLDHDHPGEGLGAHVRAARDAVQRGDVETAGQHLQAAQDRLRDHKFYTGGKGDATYRHAVGNSQLLEQHLRHASAWQPTPEPPKQHHGLFGRGKSQPAAAIGNQNFRQQFGMAVELTGTAAGAQKDTRSTSGPTAGQFVPAGSGGSGSTSTPGKPGAKGGALKPGGNKRPPGKPVMGKKSPPGKPAGNSARAKTKAGLLATAARDRAQAKQLEGQRAQILKAIAHAMASASGKKSTGQKGSKTSTGPSKTSTTGTAPKPGTTGTTKPGKPGKPGSGKPGSKAPKPGSLAALRLQLKQVNAQISQLLTAAAQATAQAAKM